MLVGRSVSQDACPAELRRSFATLISGLLSSIGTDSHLHADVHAALVRLLRVALCDWPSVPVEELLVLVQQAVVTPQQAGTLVEGSFMVLRWVGLRGVHVLLMRLFCCLCFWRCPSLTPAECPQVVGK